MMVTIHKQRIAKRAALSACALVCVIMFAGHAQAIVQDDQGINAEPAQNSSSFIDTEIATEANQNGHQQADFGHILFAYFQQQYAEALLLIETGMLEHQFSALNSEDTDRLQLMQGASQLNLGLNRQAQALLSDLLRKTSSEYVQANTWYWLAKAGFENKQFDIAESAFEQIKDNALIDYIDEKQWQELIYLTTYRRMETGGDWQSTFNLLSGQSVYPAYILTNAGVMAFNQGDYAQAQETLIEAKQALINTSGDSRAWWNIFATEDGSNPYSEADGTRARVNETSAAQNESSWLANINPLNWFEDEKDQNSEARREQANARALEKEQDALFDRINLSLAYALLQQQNEAQALDVINTISAEGGESEQALLTLGWAMAQENRWDSARALWRYLNTRSDGLYALQASYGIAYAHEQEGNFDEAFFALENTKTQIDKSLLQLSTFKLQIMQERFFDMLAAEPSQAENTSSLKVAAREQQTLAQQTLTQQTLAPQTRQQSSEDAALSALKAWPRPLLDIKRLFLSEQADFDAKYLLLVRKQAQQSLASLSQQAKRLDFMNEMLSLRQQRFIERQQALSLAKANDVLRKSEGALIALKEQVVSHETSQALRFEAKQALSAKMAPQQEAAMLKRLAGAQSRLRRLQAEDARLPKDAEARLKRLQGMLTWHFANSFEPRIQQHRQALKEAERAYSQAQDLYARLQLRKEDENAFAAQKARIDELALNVFAQNQQAQSIYAKSDKRLKQELIATVDSRIAQLKAQSVNTRLAMLRLQDLRPDI